MILFINTFKFTVLFLMLFSMMSFNNLLMMEYQIMFIINETFINFFNNVTFIFDMFSMGYFMVISMVIFNVLSFMNLYMFKGMNMKNFFFMTKLFITSMFFLVFSFNLWSMIFGWEGLGMSSFYLIFFYNNFDSWKSAIKTFINNKMGDCMLLIAMILFIMMFSMEMITIMFIMAMMTKSAQYPFMAWLPMAMSAPTPISAMVHSSTLVTAGLFIMFRYINMFMWKFNVNMIMNLCLMSMLISGMKATSEKDMKKMIALSTLSQISLIFFFLLNNMKVLSFIYMCNHALFKSLLFINMGMMMMNNFSNQLKINMYNVKLMYTYMLSYKISCLNLMNLTFFSSFFIKEKMLMLMENNYFSMMKFFLFISNSFLTMNYSLKMILFFNSVNFKSKMNFLVKTKKYNLSFLIMNLISVLFSKSCMNFYLSMNLMNIFILIMYLISMFINYKSYINKINLFEDLNYLNNLVFVFPSMMMKKNFDISEMWMEKISLNFYNQMKNKTIKKTFIMNISMIFILIMMFMFM